MADLPRGVRRERRIVPRDLHPRCGRHRDAAEALSTVCGVAAKPLLAIAVNDMVMIELRAGRRGFRVRAGWVVEPVVTSARNRPLSRAEHYKAG